MDVQIREPEHCDDCGHFHFKNNMFDVCPDRDEPCGSYLCCIN